MSGIGNSIETDLVGEVIELVRMQDETTPWPYARGLCRAVTPGHEGSYLFLWLEIRDAADAKFSEGHAFSRVQPGDILPIATDDGREPIRMRLVKQPIPPLKP